MKRFIAPLTAVLVAVIAVSVGVVGLAWAEQPAATALPGPSLDGLSNQRLIEAFDKASGSNPDRAMQIAQHLLLRRKEIPQRDLLSVITDRRKHQMTRELMIDLLAGPPEEARITDEVRGLLRDSQLDPTLKARVVVSYDFGPEDSALLSSLANDPEDMVAFHALKKLGSADFAAARGLALAALSEPEKCSDSKLSASYKVLIRSGVIHSDLAARRTLVAHLASVIDDTQTSPQLQDSAAFALADMRSLDALRALLESQRVDRILGVGAVDQNAMLIKTALEQDPDEETIELAVTAMELYPVKEIAEPLRAARDGVASPALSQRVDEVLARLAREGVPLNIKWTED